MKRSILGALGAGVGLAALVVTSTGAQDGCGGAAEGVDLAVQNARLRQREDGWVVLYTVINRGHMASTSYQVSLVADGIGVGEDDYDVGLEPGHRRRWELALPEEAMPPDGHELVVRVTTASAESAAGSSYADQCAVNDVLATSQPGPAVPGRRSIVGETSADAP